jgi:ribonuclease VapC
MSSFIDASVIAAIVGGEQDEDEWAIKLGEALAPKTSAIAVWEAARAVSRLRAIDTGSAFREIAALIDLREIEIVPLAMDEAVEAGMAHDRFGKGNHPARLNMGDCFAYACTKTNGATLFYKGDDFAQTDLA